MSKSQFDTEPIEPTESLEEDKPLTNRVYKQVNLWKEDKDYLRGKDFFNTLESIRFWLSIIGFYYLMKIIFGAIKLALGLFAAKEMSEIINQLFNVTF